eukprot:43121-Pyramimonas_sp.AAC.1
MFASVNLPTHWKDSVRNLGVMSSAGLRRDMSKLRQRRATAYRKSKKVSFLARLVGRASKLYKPGVLAVGSWGHEVLGLSPGQVKSMHAQAAARSGSWAPGACTATLL